MISVTIYEKDNSDITIVFLYQKKKTERPFCGKHREDKSKLDSFGYETFGSIGYEKFDSLATKHGRSKSGLVLQFLLPFVFCLSCNGGS